jgi:hypothetical protein
MSEPAGRVAVVFRDDAGPGQAAAPSPRLAPVFSALAGLGLAAEPVPYSDTRAEQVRDRLLAMDGVLAWVDPVTAGGDRSVLDAILREAAGAGVWIGSHPDVIARMGTKEVLYSTRKLGWGTDTHLYATPGEFRRRFPARLAADGIRVLKPSRGNGGAGIWKVMLGDCRGGAPVPGPGTMVRVQHARVRDETFEDIPLAELMSRCEPAFAAYGGTGKLIDQAFARRIGHGIIRCYLVKDRLTGFARQYPKRLAPEEHAVSGLDPDSAVAAGMIMGLPSGKAMYTPGEAAFGRLCERLEQEWLPGMQAVLGIGAGSLPVLWDADFLFGPQTASGEDSYLLCEINASSVIPFPPEAVPELARATLRAVAAARARRCRPRHAPPAGAEG